jgi:23S rRNA A2030 N6-methylase RlmJ
VLEPLVAQREGLGDRSSATYARCWLALAEVRLGNLAAARATAMALQAGAPQIEWYEARTRTHLVRSELHLADADMERAALEARQAVEIAETGDWVLLAAEARLCLARALGAAGDPAQAAEQARAASRLATAKEYAAGIAEADALLRLVW